MSNVVSLSKERERLRSGRKREVRARVENLQRITKHRLSVIHGEVLALYPQDAQRPQTRGDCANGPRPCPWVSCKHHLYLDIQPDSGNLKLNFPDIEPDEMKYSCALDIADMGGVTLEGVGEILNVTRERLRQLETIALDRVRKRAPAYIDEPPVAGVRHSGVIQGKRLDAEEPEDEVFVDEPSEAYLALLEDVDFEPRTQASRDACERVWNAYIKDSHRRGVDNVKKRPDAERVLSKLEKTIARRITVPITTEACLETARDLIKKNGRTTCGEIGATFGYKRGDAVAAALASIRGTVVDWNKRRLWFCDGSGPATAPAAAKPKNALKKLPEASKPRKTRTIADVVATHVSENTIVAFLELERQKRVAELALLDRLIAEAS